MLRSEIYRYIESEKSEKNRKYSLESELWEFNANDNIISFLHNIRE